MIIRKYEYLAYEMLNFSISFGLPLSLSGLFKRFQLMRGCFVEQHEMQLEINEILIYASSNSRRNSYEKTTGNIYYFKQVGTSNSLLL